MNETRKVREKSKTGGKLHSEVVSIAEATKQLGEKLAFWIALVKRQCH